MRSREAKERREITHYVVVLVAVSVGSALQVIGRDGQWAWVTGWVLTAAALFAGGLIYVLRINNWGIHRGRQLSPGTGDASRGGISGDWLDRRMPLAGDITRIYEGECNLAHPANSTSRLKDMGIREEAKIRGTLHRWLQRLLRNQRGSLLMETTIVLAVFGMLGTAVLGAVQTSYTSKRQFDAQSTAENLIRNQLESVFEQTYKVPGETYLATTPPDGYSVEAEALVYDETSDDIEVVRITVYHDGQLVKQFETVRSNR